MLVFFTIFACFVHAPPADKVLQNTDLAKSIGRFLGTRDLNSLTRSQKSSAKALQTNVNARWFPSKCIQQTNFVWSSSGNCRGQPLNTYLKSGTPFPAKVFLTQDFTSDAVYKILSARGAASISHLSLGWSGETIEDHDYNLPRLEFLSLLRAEMYIPGLFRSSPTLQVLKLGDLYTTPEFLNDLKSLPTLRHLIVLVREQDTLNTLLKAIATQELPSLLLLDVRSNRFDKVDYTNFRDDALAACESLKAVAIREDFSSTNWWDEW